MTHLAKVESSANLGGEPPRLCRTENTPEQHGVDEPGPAAPGPQTHHTGAAAGSRFAPRLCGDLPVDLFREGLNMLELKMRQSRCLTPLSMSSKATQAMIRQF